ncbi:MAG: hypothetical protein ABMA13_06925 [Chthoniobacteraceae bacterium]
MHHQTEAFPGSALDLRPDVIEPPRRAATPAQRMVRWALIAYSVLMLVGIALAIGLWPTSLASRETPIPENAFYVLFTLHEPAGCALQLLGLAFLWWAQRREWRVTSWARRHAIALLVGLTLVVTSIGTSAVYHRYALSLDEYCAEFQAEIFSEGKIAAPIPTKWQPIVGWLKPGFIVHDRENQTWMGPYLPVYAAMRAVFRLAGDSWMLNPVLSALSVLGIAAVARRLWPQSSAAPWLAAAFLVSSPQFLITGMSAYAMQAHLALNLAWLWLYTRQDRIGMLLAPLIGLAAVGLHQPNVHLLFALPFGVRLLWQRRWGWAAYYALAYIAALALWLAWWRWVRPDAMADSTGMMKLPKLIQLLNQPMSLVVLFSWQSLAAGVLVLLALRRWKTLPPLVRDLAWGCALTFAFHIGFDSTQGHGWGYRYCHSVLGSFMLLAVAGMEPLRQAWGERRAHIFAGASALLSLLVLCPLRALQAESIIRPFADADAALRQAEAAALLITPGAVWYGSDFVRNDPFLHERPLRVVRLRLPIEVLQWLRTEGSVADLTPEQLSRFGLIPRQTHAKPKPHDPDPMP